MQRLGLWAAWLALGPIGCTEVNAPPASALPVSPPAAPIAAPAPPATVAGDADALPALDGESLIELPIDGHEPAVVAVPLGATRPRPFVVATHGAGGRAVVHCQLWSHIVQARAFVVCPRGRSMYPGIPDRRNDAFYYVGHPQLGREMELAVAAMRARFGDYVDLQAPIFAGYSQGASMGALVLPDHPVGFARAVLVEGGVGKFQEWNVPTAARFRQRGGQRVLMVCGQVECHERAKDSARHFERAGVSVEVIYVAGAGHTYDGEMQRRVAESFAWLVEGDPRWGDGLSSSSR